MLSHALDPNRSSPLPSVVALGSITVAGRVGGEGEGARLIVSVSSKILTRLLIVSSIFSTLRVAW